MKSMSDTEYILRLNDPGGASGGSGSGGNAGGAKTIQVIDAKKFISALKKQKRKFRNTYVESKKKGAKLFRYLDYANFMAVLSSSIVEISIEDIRIEDVPVLLEHSFNIEDVEIDSDEGNEESSEEG